MREQWFEQLFEAIQNDDPPYLDLLDERWGDLCATPEVTTRWADRPMGLVRHVRADRRRGQFAFTRAESACYSALFAAGRRIEAYEKYALEANLATTCLATYRLVSKKYSELDADQLLTDLVATTPGEEGKWFATAKTLKRFDLAIQLA